LARLEKVSIDVSDISLLTPDGGEVVVGRFPGVQVLILWRHRH
jgi:hypothetical protein